MAVTAWNARNVARHAGAKPRQPTVLSVHFDPRFPHLYALDVHVKLRINPPRSLDRTRGHCRIFANIVGMEFIPPTLEPWRHSSRGS